MSEEINKAAIDQTQKIRTDCAIYAEGYRQSVQSFVAWSELTAWLSAVVCFVYFVLFSLWSANQAYAYTLGVVQTLLSAILFVITLYSLFRRWQTKQEYQNGLALKYLNLLKQIEVELATGSVTPEKASEFQHEFQNIETERVDTKGNMSQRYVQEGHQHCAKKYPMLKLKCYECDRVWQPEFERRTISIWKSSFWLPWKHEYCNNCGVQLDE